jgi:hypothetical protein
MASEPGHVVVRFLLSSAFATALLATAVLAAYNLVAYGCASKPYEA